mmetsp:Transcript_5541/g.11094  ORF Transcript_5541/g.11094 Transcript_5541/m.11094 type:complete len:221 (-) Transcript_5541:22-684(-)
MSWEEARKTPWKTLSSVETNAQSMSTTASSSSSSSSSSSPSSSSSSSSIESTTTTTPTVRHTVFFGLIPTSSPFLWTDLGRNSLFGLAVGGITGITFGFMDGMKQVQESNTLKSISNRAKGAYIMRGTGTTGMIFGGFFTAFHAGKYLLRVTVGAEDPTQIAGSAVASLGGLAYFQRRLMPYGILLVGMDSFNLLFRDDGETSGMRPDGTFATTGDEKKK